LSGRVLEGQGKVCYRAITGVADLKELKAFCREGRKEREKSKRNIVHR